MSPRCSGGWPCSGRSSCERWRSRDCSGEMPRCWSQRCRCGWDWWPVPGPRGITIFWVSSRGRGSDSTSRWRRSPCRAAMPRRPWRGRSPRCAEPTVIWWSWSEAGDRRRTWPFDAEVVARAIAVGAKPIWTGIGHTGDESVADIVANQACITPTECGHQLVLRAGQWWEQRVAGPARVLSRRVPSLLGEADGSDAAARGRLTRGARSQLRVHRERLGGACRRRWPVWPPRGLSARQGASAHQRRPPGSLGARPRGAGKRRRVRSWRRLLTAYDVERQLERGYTLTLTADGELVRSAAATSRGQRGGDPFCRRDGPLPGGVGRGPRRRS